MKKKVGILVLAAALLLALSGCACEHEWIEADCLTPKTCAKCEEVEGEALGHSWAEATCMASETCSNCGETQGEALPHTFGKWVMGETEMTHTCNVCGTEESAEIDRELFAKQAIIGRWELYSQTTNGQSLSAYRVDAPYHADVREDGSFRFTNNSTGEATDFQWEYISYQDFYLFMATHEDGSMFSMTLQDNAEEDYLGLIFDEKTTITLFRDERLMEGMAGYWGAVENGNFYSLELAEDQTFTADLNGEEITGTWHVKPLTTSEYYKDALVFQTAFNYVQGEKPFVTTSSIIMIYGDDVKASLYANSFSLNISGINVRFNHTNEAGLAKLKASIEDGPKNILGDWTSKVVNIYPENGASETKVVTDYSMTFLEDGTFTAALDKEYTGTWEYNEATTGGSAVGYRYYLHFDGVSEQIYATINDKNLSFSKYDQSTSTSTSIDFSRLSAEDAAKLEQGPELVVGTWTAFNGSWYNQKTQQSETYDVSGYTITVNEDGTYTGTLDMEVGGSWSFDDYNPEEGYEQGYSYLFETGDQSYTVYQLNLEGILRLYREIDGNYITIRMAKTS